ncbi:MAG TPA: hypothetical protein VHG91_04825 [Longimicrobium sp.]|nr:hypothetical protein [Longimicrobium sp.]
MNVSAVQIPPDARAAHRGLSPAAERFLEYLVEHPDEAGRLEGMEDVLPKWTFTYDFTPLTWPVFVDAAKLAELKRATEGVCGLIKAVPAVVFDGDVEAIAAFYGYEHPEYVEMLFEVPNPLDSTFARCDFIDTPGGLKCCEVNLAANIGGWQHRFWEETYLRHPVVTAFAAREGFTPRWRDPLRAAVRQVAEDAVATGVADGGEVNVVVPFPRRLSEWAERFARELYADLLHQVGGGVNGQLWVSTDPAAELDWRDNVPYFGGRRVHVYVEYGLDTPPQVLRAQVAGKLRVYNGGLTRFLVDKRNLALLSENEGLEYWTDEDRDLIRAHVPWTRLVSERTTTYRGETVEFPAFLLERREEMVLKLGAGFGGADVFVGRHTEPAAWETAVREAVAHGGWIVQEYVASKPYLYPPRAGAAPVPHSVIWGLFCTGWRYAGAWLRMLPAGTGDGIVNSGRGAAEGAVLEVG